MFSVVTNTQEKCAQERFECVSFNIEFFLEFA